MRIGIGVGEIGGSAVGVDGIIDQVRVAADLGFSGVWAAQIFGFDALTLLSLAGAQVPDIALGTAVIPTYPRHPMALAAQALTAQAATANRVTLGVGLSHKIVIEGMFGYSFDKPARHMREYLSALVPLLRGEQVSYKGETLQANGALTAPGATKPDVLVAALGPAMLKITGELAEGTVTWMTGPNTIADHTVPTLTAAASAAGRPAPRVVVGLPISVTSDVAKAHELASRQFSIYGQLPSYRAMLDREGAAGPADVAIAGDEDTVAGGVKRVADAGATELLAIPFGTAEEVTRTMGVLAELNR